MTIRIYNARHIFPHYRSLWLSPSRLSFRCVSNESVKDRSLRKPFFITTPIFYVNAAPHIGHLYTAVIADAVARWHRIRGSTVLFSTGTDEHGLKIQQAADKQKCSPIQLCDNFSATFQKLFDAADIQYDDYIRTTENRHVEKVQEFWQCLERKGYIYKDKYKGWYCVADEAFVAQSDVCEKTHNGNTIMVSRESGRPVEWMEEENYMFRLSDMTSRIRQWLDTKPVRPSHFEGLVRQWLDGGLSDLSVSRQTSRLNWGIPVPGDPEHTIYVWLDALVNYLTVSVGHQCWPPDCHVIGKDILRFHAVYWPAFLLAADMPPPANIMCHSHWTRDHVKMSKSLGNVVDPMDEISKYTSDGVRYFLLREGVPHSDGSYRSEKVRDYVNSELVNTLGNLLQRCSASAINPKHEFPSFDQRLFCSHVLPEFSNIMEDLSSLWGQVDGHYCNYEVYRGLDLIMHQLRQANAFMQAHKPWKLAAEQSEWRNTILHVCLATVHQCSLLLQPAVPQLAARLLDKLSVPVDKQRITDLSSYHGKLSDSHGHFIERIK